MIVNLTLLSFYKINKQEKKLVPEQIKLYCKRLISNICTKFNKSFPSHIKNCDIGCVLSLCFEHKLIPDKRDFYYAVRYNKLDIIKFIYKKYSVFSANNNIISFAVFNENLQMIKYLVKNKICDISICDLEHANNSSYDIFIYLLTTFLKKFDKKISFNENNNLINDMINNNKLIINNYSLSNNVTLNIIYKLLLKRGDLVLIDLIRTKYNLKTNYKYLVKICNYDVIDFINNKEKIDWIHLTNEIVDRNDIRVLKLYLHHFDNISDNLGKEYLYLVDNFTDYLLDVFITKYILIDQLIKEAMDKKYKLIYEYLISV